MAMSPDQDFVLKTIKSRDVHFVRFWFCDVLGNMKSFAVIPSELENAFEEGMGFDASCVQGFSLNYESDMLTFVNASEFLIHANAETSWTLDGEYQEGCEEIKVENLHHAINLMMR